MTLARLGNREAPLSFAQERLWFIHAAAAGSATYNVPLFMRWTEPVDPAALTAALTAVAQRHEVLRTTYQVRDGRPVQVIGDRARVAVQVVPTSGDAGQIRREALRWARMPFDLGGEPPVRCVVWRGGPDGDAVLLCVHHIAVDGWSLAPLLTELAEAYQAALDGRPADLGEPPIQYSDFAAWDRDAFGEPSMAGRLAARVDELLGVPGDIALGDLRRQEIAPEGARPGDQHVFAVPAEVWSAVGELATALRVTPFVALFAAFQAVLRRWVDREEFLVATITANRPHRELEELVGFFVNTVPLRCRVPSDVTFRQLCGQARTESFKALTYQRIPFDQLTAAARAKGAGPLANIAFALQNMPPPRYRTPPKWAAPVLLPTGTAKYDLLLLLDEGPDGLVGTLEYALDRYSADVVSRFAESFTTLLAAAVAEPDRPVRDLPVTERAPGELPACVLVGPHREPPDGAATVLDVLASRFASADPDSPAVSGSGVDVSWRELDEWADGVARGVPDMPYLPVVAARGGAMAAGWLGVLRTGAAYVPLGVDIPPQRAAYILDEIGATAVLADDVGAKLVAGLGVDVDVLRLEELRAAPGDGDRCRFAEPRPDSPALVLYTSGTTGRPKGLVIAHRGLLNTVLWWRDEDGLRAGDRVLCTWSTQFDAATFDTFRCLAAGAHLRYADDVERRDPQALLDHLRGPRGATVTSMTPSLLRAMLDADDRDAPTTLRAVTLGGEALTRQLVTECTTRWGARVLNIYGPAEVSCVSTAAWIDPGEERPTIGLPIPNNRGYVLGRDLAELPVGAPGELFMAGAGVSLGYFAQPERTAEAYLPDPYCSGGRMYRTGDQVAIRPDGRLDFLGRYDDQVKILGNRIEPEEVRKLLGEQPGVRAAAVQPEGEPKRLVAYVVLADRDELPTREELVEPLLRWLPPPALPAEVYVVDAMPLTGNDKTDFRALRQMRSLRLRSAAREGVELTLDQRAAAEVIADVVGVAGGAERLRPDSNFFALGGHSLRAVGVVDEAQRRLGAAVSLRDFLAEPTVAGLARLLAAAPPAQVPTQVPASPATAEPSGGRHLATSVQQRLWFLDRVSKVRAAYLIPTLIELTGPVDRERLLRALNLVLARHPALRTRFELDRKLRRVCYRTDGAPPVAELAPAGIDLTTLCWTPFDLAHEAPARARVVADGERTVLALITHHAVVDGWSLRVLLDQLALAYRDDGDSGLPEPVHPASLAGAAAAPARTGKVTDRLRGAPPDVALPFDRPRPEIQSIDADTVTTTLGGKLVARLRAVAGELGCSMFVTAAALLAASLARHGPQRDFLFAFPWSGRDAAGSANAVGMFVNTLVLRVDLRDTPSWRDLLVRVREQSTACYRDADVPFDDLVAALHPDRDLSRPPLTPVFIGFFDGPMATPDLGPGVAARFLPVPALKVKYELDLSVTDLGDDIELTAAYPTDLFDAATVSRLLGSMVICAAELTADPGAACDPRR